MVYVLNILSEIGRSCFQYIGFLAVACILVFLYLGCCYWRFRRSYAIFPSFTLDFPLFITWLKGKIPTNIPFSSYLFNEVLSISKRFRDEGLFILWGLRPILVIFDEKYFKIFSNETAALEKVPFVYNIIAEMIGRGLLTNGGTSWKERRKNLNVAFRFDVLRNHVSVLNENAKFTVKKLAEKCNKPTDEVQDIIKFSSLKILCETVLGIKANSKEREAKMRRYLELLSSLTLYTVYRVARPWLYWKYPQLLFQAGRNHWRLYREFKNFSKCIVEEMKESIYLRNSESIQDDSTVTCGSGKSFTHILLENHMKDPSFSMEDIQDEVDTIIFAGHDTTAFATLWCLFMLGLHPDVQEKAFEEAESVIGNGTTYSYSDLSRLTYLECVIKETLRLYPPVPGYGRVLKKDVQLEKFTVPKNTVIGFFPYMLLRNPEFYPDPEKFDPDRFSGNSLKHPWAYTVFSEGIRSCLGKNFAMMEMKIILAHILRSLKVTSLDRRDDVKLDYHLILSPVNPIRFQFTCRQSHLLPKG